MNKNISSPGLLLVHGAWHDSQCWGLLKPELEKLGLQVFTPDLPGHSTGSIKPARVTMRTYLAALGEILERQHNPMLVVGHSMAGMVISQLAEMYPNRISKLVYLSAYLPIDGDSLFSIMEQYHAECDGDQLAIETLMKFSADRKTCTLDEAAGSIFYHDCPESVRAAANLEMSVQPLLPLGTRLVLHTPPDDLPAKHYIACQQDRVLPLSIQQWMLDRAELQQVSSLDSGHSPFYSCPDRLASLLLELASG